MLDDWSFGGAERDTNQYLVEAKFRETLSAAVLKFDIGRFDLKKLRNVGVKEECPVKISTKLVAFENLDFNGDINRIWENIKENIKISEKEEVNYYDNAYPLFYYCITIKYQLMYTLKAAFCSVLHMNVCDQMWLNGDSWSVPFKLPWYQNNNNPRVK